MLKGRLLHPEILGALGRAGHGAKVLIADGNYPFSTKRGRNAGLVQLNLAPGVVSCTQILEVLAAAIPIEAAVVMDPGEGVAQPEVWGDFASILKGAAAGVELGRLDRFVFYEAASDDDVALTIASGEQRIFANLLLTIGGVSP